ncbi:MAG: LamG-like jellyroll fold domain-containing protein, partial [Planctomycetota bacterium]
MTKSEVEMIQNRLTTNIGCLVVAAGCAVSAHAQPQVTVLNGFLLQSWNAATEVPGRDNWHSESPTSSWSNGLRWDWQENTMPDGSGSPVPPSAVPVFDPAAPGIEGAYQFPAARAATILPDGTGARGANWENVAAAGISASFEIWFKPSDLTGSHVLWEIGATNKGVAISLDDDELVFSNAANDGMGGNSYVYEHREPLTGTDWHQAVMVISYNDFTVTSYVNGVAVNTGPIADIGEGDSVCQRID